MKIIHYTVMVLSKRKRDLRGSNLAEGIQQPIDKGPNFRPLAHARLMHHIIRMRRRLQLHVAEQLHDFPAVDQWLHEMLACQADAMPMPYRFQQQAEIVEPQTG